jgi:hypothetical protein
VFAYSALNCLYLLKFTFWGMCVAYFIVLIFLVRILEVVLLKILTAEWKVVRNSSHFHIQVNGACGHYTLAPVEVKQGYWDGSLVVISYGGNFWSFRILSCHGDPHPVLRFFGFSH